MLKIYEKQIKILLRLSTKEMIKIKNSTFLLKVILASSDWDITVNKRGRSMVYLTIEPIAKNEDQFSSFALGLWPSTDIQSKRENIKLFYLLVYIGLYYFMNKYARSKFSLFVRFFFFLFLLTNSMKTYLVWVYDQKRHKTLPAV